MKNAKYSPSNTVWNHLITAENSYSQYTVHCFLSACGCAKPHCLVMGEEHIYSEITCKAFVSAIVNIKQFWISHLLWIQYKYTIWNFQKEWRCPDVARHILVSVKGGDFVDFENGPIWYFEVAVPCEFASVFQRANFLSQSEENSGSYKCSK